MYKEKDAVIVTETGYLEGSKYQSHVSGRMVVLSIVPDEKWDSPYVPEYIVAGENSIQYLVPEYSIGRLK